MREKIIVGYLRSKMACHRALEDFVREEKGASQIMEIMIVVVIMIAVAGVFKEQLMEAVNAMFGKLIGFMGE